MTKLSRESETVTSRQMNMSDSTSTTFAQIERRALHPDPGTAELARMCRRRGDAVRRRHTAIATNVPNWSSYRSWAYQARGSWEKETS
jgi:hypothetical protein